MTAPQGKMQASNGAALCYQPTPGHQDWSLMPEQEYKRCTKCREEKPIGEFGPNRRQASGLQPACRACENRYWRSWRERNLEKQREVEREKQKKLSEAQRPKKSARQRRRRARHPEKLAANVAVQRAVEQGELVRPDTCEDCRTVGLPHAHHPDYSKPLEVEWLCSGCHGRRHAGTN